MRVEKRVTSKMEKNLLNNKRGNKHMIKIHR